MDTRDLTGDRSERLFPEPLEEGFDRLRWFVWSLVSFVFYAVVGRWVTHLSMFLSGIPGLFTPYLRETCDITSGTYDMIPIIFIVSRLSLRKPDLVSVVES